MTDEDLAKAVKQKVSELLSAISAAENKGLSVDLNYSFSESISGAKQHYFAARVYKVI